MNEILNELILTIRYSIFAEMAEFTQLRLSICKAELLGDLKMKHGYHKMMFVILLLSKKIVSPI